jgi:hypothetical protein
MTPYGYISKQYRFVFGPGNFEFPETGSSVEKKLMPLFLCYLEPQYPGQEPWGGVVPDIGLVYYYTENIGELGIEPLYLGVEE